MRSDGITHLHARSRRSYGLPLVYVQGRHNASATKKVQSVRGTTMEWPNARGKEKALVENRADGKWYGVECAANAGEPTAITLRAFRHAREILERLIMPVQKIDKGAA